MPDQQRRQRALASSRVRLVGITSSPLRPGRRTWRLRAIILLVLLSALSLGLFLSPPLQERIAQTRWYLTDETPPQMAIAVPAQTIRGVITASLVITDDGPFDLESLSLDGKPVSPTQQVVIDTATLPDGDHTLLAQAADRSRKHNAGKVGATFRSENTPPTLSATLDPPLVSQGQTLLIRLASSKPATITASLDGGPLNLAGPEGLSATAPSTHPCGGADCWALLGFGPEARAVTHTLTFRAVDRLGNSSQFSATFSVTVTRFVIEDIVLPPDRAGLANTDAETKRLDAAFATVSPSQFWQGRFVAPATGEVTAPFGEARSYDGGPVASHHGGVDLAAPFGGPVAAAAAGRVLLAGAFAIQGNAVLIDHGLGLVSAYFHLSAFSVKPGDMVRQGQTVGLVGNTGSSTGPHLHWEMRLLGQSVDPWEWTKRNIP
jgi:murein DD-endopeptidase MepM/ murein hydrolase activator NlpD